VRGSGIPFFSALFKAPAPHPAPAGRTAATGKVAGPGIAPYSLPMMTDPSVSPGHPAAAKVDKTKLAKNQIAETQLAKTQVAKTQLAKTKLTEVVVVCAKCAKRQGLRPRAVRALLKGAAKQAAKDGLLADRTKLCIVESGCLGPCPKRAVAVATGASLAAGRVVLLDPDSKPEEALAAVLRPVLPQPRPPNSAPIRP